MSTRTSPERERSPLPLAKAGQAYRVAQIITYSLAPTVMILMAAEPRHHVAKAALALMGSLFTAILN